VKQFKIYTTETAPEKAKETLQLANKKFNMIPNVLGCLAESPETLKAYMSLSQLFEEGTFTPLEKQVVLLTVSFENDCQYCMAAHTAVAKMSSTPDKVINQIRSGHPISIPKLEALRNFTILVTQKKGELSPFELKGFFDAGFTPLEKAIDFCQYYRSFLIDGGSMPPSIVVREHSSLTGFTKAQVFEVILGVALKNISNYANHVVNTPLDQAFEPFKWEHPDSYSHSPLGV